MDFYVDFYQEFALIFNSNLRSSFVWKGWPRFGIFNCHNLGAYIPHSPGGDSIGKGGG